MGVYIPNISMPECCMFCFYNGRCFKFGRLNNGDYPSLEQVLAYGLDMKRIDDCPLVEVPVPHGRLIDAGELSKWADVNPLTDDGGVDINELEEYLDNAPTIIEAEED